MVTANEILEFNDIKEQLIEIPEWGNKKILVRGMNGETTFDISMRMQKTGVPSAQDMAKIVVNCTFDPETKKPVFQEVHAAALAQKNFAALMRIVTVAIDLSGINAPLNAETARKN